MHGRVVDENGAPVRDAHISISGLWEGNSDPGGLFDASLPSGTKDLTLTIEREGFYALKEQHVHLDGNAVQEVTFVLNTVREVFQSENVNAQTSPVDVGQTQHEEHLSGTQVNDIPFANSHSFRSAIQLFPGVLTDANGEMHVNGAQENQVLYLFNGFTINDPITGQFDTLVPIEGIRSVDLSSGQTSAEFGNGSAGVMKINTETGTDRYHYTATDFIPGVDVKQGLRFGDWYPRVGVSGPIEKGRAWFSDLFESQYSQALITGLPKGQNTRNGWAGANILHGQWNTSASNILFADFLVNIDNEGRYGLAPLNPIDTTYALRTREYLGSIKEQKYFGHGLLVEVGFAYQATSVSQTPYGDGLLITSPEGYSGYSFVRSKQLARREEGLAQVFLPKRQFLGSHQFQLGTTLDWLHYNGDFHRTGYEVLGLSGQLLAETLYSGTGQFAVPDRQFAVYFVDTWSIAERLQVNWGLRTEHDSALGGTGWEPRAAVSWSPAKSAKTRVSGGYSITHDVVTMQMLGAPLDQISTTTSYNSDGSPTGPPALSRFEPIRGGYSLPRATNWSAGVDQELWRRIYAGVRYLRRRGSDEFRWVNTLAPDAPLFLQAAGNPQPALYLLTNSRRDDYDSIAFEARQTLKGQYGWTFSYIRSESRSNALIDASASVPVEGLPDFVQTPWNVPNRLIASVYAPLPWKKWSIAALVAGRSGFPFSIRETNGLIVGNFDSYRYPVNFDLNLAVERMMTLRGYRFALRGGVDNLTNQGNPTAVNAVVGAPQFLQFLGDEGRHFVVRIRFFERAGK